MRKVESKLELMGSVKEIEEAVLKLSAAELAAFRAWFADFDAEAWDRQIEDDVAAGRLRVVVDRTYPLAEAATAHAYIESRQAFGRVVLVP